MWRHLVPRINAGRWGGGTLADPEGLREEACGTSFAIQWLGLLVEIGAGRVRQRGRKPGGAS